jgi:Guanylate kinase
MLKNLYLIVGPSGVGKTTIAKELTKRFGYFQVRSYTTRPPRFEGEEGYIFLTPQEFSALPQKIACVTFNGYEYTTTAQALDNNDIYVVEPSGVKEVREQYKNRPVYVIGLTAPEEVLKNRMLNRGDVLPYVEERISNDKKVFAGFTGLCDTVVVNDSLESVIAEIQKFIADKERTGIVI